MAKIETYAQPTWLYRYRSLGKMHGEPGRADPVKLEQELDAIESNYLFCARYRDMNDPMEGFFRSSTGLRQDKSYRDAVELVRNEKLGIGIACLSETWHNDLMWAHYAEGFRGICIAYSVQKLLEGLSENSALSRVAYGDRPHYLNMRGVRSLDGRARAILSAKSLTWAYEREWRVLAPSTGKVDHGRGVVSRVYLGMRMADEDRDLITHRLGLGGIKVSATKVDGYSVTTVSSASRRI